MQLGWQIGNGFPEKVSKKHILQDQVVKKDGKRKKSSQTFKPNLYFKATKVQELCSRYTLDVEHL